MNSNSRSGLFFVVTICFLLTGCFKGGEKHVPVNQRVETISYDSIRVTFTINPSKVELNKDVLLTIEVSAPVGTGIIMPETEGRLTGFVLSGSFNQKPYEYKGKTIYKKYVVLTPMPANEYRLAPMAFIYQSGTTSTNKKWFASPVIIFETAISLNNNSKEDIDDSLSPVRIYPPLMMIIYYSVLIIFSGICLIFFIYYCYRKISNTSFRLHKLYKKHALKELSILLTKKITRKEEVKEFYIELTMIVRRYIEQSYNINAMELTTPEFIRLIRNDSRFSRKSIEALKAFMDVVDLIKFTGNIPAESTMEEAFNTAREYLETDFSQMMCVNRES